MKKFIFLLIFSSLVFAGCKKEEEKEIKNPSTKIEIHDDKDAYIKKTEVSDNKTPEISENKTTKTVTKPFKNNKKKTDKKNEENIYKATYISLEGYNYKCCIDKENQRITVEFKNETVTGKLDLDTFTRLENLIGYIEEDKDRYSSQAKMYGYSAAQIDIEGWIGDVLYTFAKGANVDDRKENYYDHAITCMEEMEKIMACTVPFTDQASSSQASYNTAQEMPFTDGQKITLQNLEYNDCVYVTDIKYQKDAGDALYDSSYGVYAYSGNERIVIAGNLPGGGEYANIMDRESMLKIWDYITGGRNFPLAAVDKYAVVYSLGDTSTHVRPLAANLDNGALKLTIETSINAEHTGEMLVIPLNDSLGSLIIKKENYN